MTGHAEKKSFRNFPADMFVLSGIPIVGVAFLTSLLWSLNTIEVQIAMGLAFLVAVTGAVLLFWAKLPLYKKGIYFSFGHAMIPEKRKVFYYWGLSLTCIGCVLALMLIPLR